MPLSRLHLPNKKLRLILIFCGGTKKGMGVSTFRLSQSFRPSHCPCIKDKQRSQPTPSENYHNVPNMVQITYQYQKLAVINHPRRRLVALSL